ncbi:MAG: hypothetical protein OQJ77_05325, partial [Thiovulaceae bacterium]|nr:hypothetical protein [Sulfurimonadaceae bacterium]
MNIKSLLYILTILLIITGCSTSKQKIQEQKIINEFDGAPTWIKAPKLENYISDVGISLNTAETFNIQRDAAIEKAKANLAQKLNEKIINIFSLIGKKYINDDIFLEKIEDANNLLVSNAINESRVTKLWKSNNNNIYVMVSSNISKLKKDLRNIVETSFKDFSKIQG